LLVVIGGILVYVARSPEGDGTPSDRGVNFPGVGSELTALRLEPLTGDGEPLELSDLRGKVAVVNFWGPWCYFCRKELPHLEAMNRRFAASEGVQMAFVTYGSSRQQDTASLREDTEACLAELNVTVPTHFDPNAKSLEALARDAQLPNIGFPITVVLDRNAIIRGLWIGYLPGEEAALEALVKQLL
jgi:thiol-disulfide isomerase/thioredoxin